MKKIFLNHHLLILTKKPNKYTDIPSLEIKKKKDLISFMENWVVDDLRDDIIVYGYPVKKMMKHLRLWAKYVEAGGGVVKNKEGKILFIRRWDRWDLPKGKREKNEKKKQCAIREVQEETGVTPLKIISKLPSSYHLYEQHGKWHLKKTFWYYMTTTFSDDLKPLVIEDIIDARWMNNAECLKAFSESYRSLREILARKVCSICEK